MKKIKLFLSVDKEEQWINTIEEEGYRLTSIIPLYSFEKTTIIEPFVPYVRLDYREKWLEITKGSRYGGIQYFQ